jgi:hypothetical protein
VAKDQYEPTNPNDSDQLVDPGAITATDRTSLENARANAGIGVDGEDARTGAPAEEGGSGGSNDSDDALGRVGSAPAGSAPATIAGTGEPVPEPQPVTADESTGSGRSTRSGAKSK